MRLLALLPVIALTACMLPKDKARVNAMEQQIAELSTRVDRLENSPARPPVRTGPSDSDERAAAELVKKANDQVSALDYDAARASLARLESDYPDTRGNRSASRLRDELAVIGVTVSPLNAQRWFTQAASVTQGTVFVVAWEEWCPHCKREIPRINARYDRLLAAGFTEVVGVTKVTKSSTDEKVEGFVADNGLRFPIAKEGGELSAELGIRGIPAAAVLRDGEVIWRGHPARLTDEVVAQIMGE